MSLALNKSTQFHINELSIVTKGGPIDISVIYEEINLYDSLFLPVMSGNILINDSVGLSSMFLFDGSESILIDIAKDKNSDVASFKKAFRIYKQSNRVANGSNNEKYMLHFCSDELMFSDQQKINQSYDETYGKIVVKIMEDYLEVPEGEAGGYFEDTEGLRNVVIPNLRPLDAIEWITKRCLDQNQAPNYVFFQNLVGFNFVPLSKLLTNDELLDINFTPKNVHGNSAFDEIDSARGFEVVKQNDSITKQRSGVNAGKFIGFDPMTRVTATKKISYGDVYGTMEHANENPNASIVGNRDGSSTETSFDSKKTVSMFSMAQNFSNYIKKNAPEMLSKLDNQENWMFQRKAIIENLMAKRLKIAMPGNFQLTSGFNVNVNAPPFGMKIPGDENKDVSLSGKYIIVASRHIIGYNKHETIIEVATTSSEAPVTISSGEQLNELLEF
jgi:hypothetical protein